MNILRTPAIRALTPTGTRLSGTKPGCWSGKLLLIILTLIFACMAKPALSNVDLAQSAVASSQHSSPYAPQFAVDGEPGTRWSSAFLDNQWIRVDLGTSLPINRVVLSWEWAYGKGYLIQVSNDATNWTTVFTEVDGDGGIDDITFDTVNARYVRMYGTERASEFGFSLWAFEVYGGATCIDLPVSYDFSPGNAGNWSIVNETALSSLWQVTSGEYHQRRNVGDPPIGFDQSYKLGTYAYEASLTCLSNYSLSVDITPVKDDPPQDHNGGKDVGIMFRYQGPNHFYRLSFNSRAF